MRSVTSARKLMHIPDATERTTSRTVTRTVVRGLSMANLAQETSVRSIQSSRGRGIPGSGALPARPAGPQISHPFRGSIRMSLDASGQPSASSFSGFQRSFFPVR